MREKLELYENISKSREVAEYLKENKREFERHDEQKKDHSGDYSYDVDTGFVDANRLDIFECPEKAYIRKYAYEMLYAAVAALNESQRSRLIKRFWENKSYREIAREENIDVHAVENSITRALKHLRNTLSGTGISYGDFAQHPKPVQYIKNTKRTQRRHDRRMEKNREAEVMADIAALPKTKSTPPEKELLTYAVKVWTPAEKYFLSRKTV